MASGPVVDSESTPGLVQPLDGAAQDDVISYARLAATMQMAATDGQWTGRFVTPAATTTSVPAGWKYMDSAWETIAMALRDDLLPWVVRRVGLGLVGVGLGYVLGIREQGDWLARRFGIDLRT
jgi:hypothetical protein